MDDYGDPILGMGYTGSDSTSLLDNPGLLSGATLAPELGLDQGPVSSTPPSPAIVATPLPVALTTTSMPTASLLQNSSDTGTGDLLGSLTSIGDSLLNSFVINPQNAQTAEQQAQASTANQVALGTASATNAIAISSNLFSYLLLGLGLVLLLSIFKR